ncbi:MAG: GNAT family N-acetyltransferase [Pseudomonadales bacterium]|nr:GNAT family N-acetyltransferase [Pseudomonadales bacterium]
MEEAFFEQERHNIPTMYLPNADTWVALIDNSVMGFIALIGNEVGGFFVDPDQHGQGLGKALLDKAQDLHGDLDVDVFKLNILGRRFYNNYGFKFLQEKTWHDTGDIILRLGFKSCKN